MTARKPRPRYDYVHAIFHAARRGAENFGEEKRILRKLVREAVTMAYGPRDPANETTTEMKRFARLAQEGVRLEADAIARRLAP